MNYLLILSGYENQVSFWERLLLNVPSVTTKKLDVIFCENLMNARIAPEYTAGRNNWFKEVQMAAKEHKLDIGKEIKNVSLDSELKKILKTAECTIFSHNILNELNKKGLLDFIKGSIISFDSYFQSVQNCIIVFDKKVNSIQNFEKFFNHFAKTMKNAEVVLLMEIGKTLNEAAKNRKAVSFMVGLFKSVGVITYPPEELRQEVLRYIALKKNAVVIIHKSNYETIVEPKFKEKLQNRKIAYYLDEF